MRPVNTRPVNTTIYLNRANGEERITNTSRCYNRMQINATCKRTSHSVQVKDYLQHLLINKFVRNETKLSDPIQKQYIKFKPQNYIDFLGFFYGLWIVNPTFLFSGVELHLCLRFTIDGSLFYRMISWIYIQPESVVVMIVWQLDLQLHVQSVPITTNVVSSNHAHSEVYSIQ